MAVYIQYTLEIKSMIMYQKFKMIMQRVMLSYIGLLLADYSASALLALAL